jgi:bifunctional non-homologous end joining protein LigD
MTDQLSLRLETDLPNPPASLRPMRARTVAAPFDSPDHLFEPSWGGRRALVYVGPAETEGAGDVALVGEDGAPIVPVPPELVGLGVRVAARSAVLDGELVVVDAAGRVEADELRRRLAGAPGRPVAFLAFDLLHLDGRSLLALPLERRRDLLRRVLRPADEVVAVPAIAGEGRALFEAVAAQGLAGVLARHRASPYLPGMRSRLWRFIPASAQERDTAAAEAALADVAGPTGGVGAVTERGNGPVLALIRRLPLGLEEPVELDEEPA